MMFLMFTSIRRAVDVVAAFGLLAGCEVTVLDSVPAGGPGRCDARLAGAWVAVGDSFVSSVVVDAGCTATLLGDGIPSGSTIALRDLDEQGHWIALEASELARVLPEGTWTAPVPDGSWLPAWWSRSGDGLVLGQPDARH